MTVPPAGLDRHSRCADVLWRRQGEINRYLNRRPPGVSPAPGAREVRRVDGGATALRREAGVPEGAWRPSRVTAKFNRIQVLVLPADERADSAGGPNESREGRLRGPQVGQRALAVLGALLRLLRGPGADVEVLSHGMRS